MFRVSDRLLNPLFLLTRDFINNLTFQFSSESTSENPFRDGGKLSRDAQDIVDAVKTGKLSVISHKEVKDDRNDGQICTNVLEEEYNENESLVKPIIRKNAVIQSVPKSKNLIHKTENVKENKQKCCAIL